MTQLARNRRVLGAMIALFTVLSLAMVIGGSAASRREAAVIHGQRYNELHAIATLKVDQLVAWRSERLGDAHSGASHLAKRQVFSRLLSHPTDGPARESILQDLALLRDAYGYRTAALLGLDGKVLCSLDPPPSDAEAGVKALADQALRVGGPVLGDIFRGPDPGGLHLDAIAPVPGPEQQPLAFLLLRSDPEARLYPLIQSWPTPSETAETLLVRREGAQVRFLNRLRHVPEPPLALTQPVSRPGSPAGEAVMGRVGEFLGDDYRGQEVLADLQPVPGTTWYMVAKVDTREILSEARYRAGMIRGLTALGVLLCAVLGGLLFYLGEAKLYYGLFQATRFAERLEAEPEASAGHRLKRWARLLGLFGLTVGLVVLLGWVFDLPALKGTLPGFATTKANTAVGIVLAGAALALLASPRVPPAAARACAAALLVLGALTLVEHLTGVDLQIDQALFRAPAGMYGALAPGRMAPITALNFVLAGCALLLASFPRTAAASQLVALLIGLVALFALVGHLLGSIGGYGLGRYLQMTFPATLASIASSLGLLLLRPSDGLMRRVTALSMGGWLLRHVAPFLFGMPLLIAWAGAEAGARGWLEPSVAAALGVAAFVAFMMAAAWWAAHALDHLDAIRNRAEESLRESQSQLQLLLDSAAEAVYGIDLHGECTFCNRTFLQMMGYPDVEQVLGRNMHDLVHHSYRDGTPFPVEDCRIFRAFQEGKGTHVDDEVLWRADGTSFAAEYWSFPQLRDGQVVGSVVTFIDITTRRQAQEALRESREMLSHVLDTIPQSVFWKDLESRYLGCNRAFAQQVGLGDPAQIVGKTDFDLPWPREEAEAYRADDHEVMESNRPKVCIVEPLQKADGGRLWIETSKVPLRTEEGRPYGLLGIYDDTTERKRMEDALKASEAWHRAILRTTMDGFMVVDAEGRILQANEAYAHMSGYSLEELSRMRIADLDAVERPEETVAHLHTILQQGQHRFETRHRHRDGRIIDLEVSVQVVPGDVGQLVSFMRDVTERKRAEATLRANQVRLAEAQALAHLGSWEMDLATQALSWSDEFYRIFGLDPAQARASIDIFLEMLHPEDREVVEREFYTAVAAGAPYQLVHRLCLADGTIKHVEVRGSTIRDSEGRTIRAAGTMQDITDLKRAEESLRESEERLRVLSDNLPGGMVYQVDSGLDGSLRLFTYVSAGVQRLHGVTPDQAREDAMAIYGQIHEEDRAALAQQEAAAVAAMVPFSGEYRVRHPSGEIRWYLGTSSPRRLANGHLVWDGIEFDITKRKGVDQELQKTHRELQQIFKNMINAFVLFESVFDDDGNYTSFRFGLFNDAYGRISKLDYETVRGKDVFEVWPETEQSWVEAYGSVATTGIPRTFDMYHTSTNGWYHCNAYRPTDSPSHVCVIFEDITEKKIAEERIEAAQVEMRRLLESADRSRLALLSLLEDQRIAEVEIWRLNADLERRVADRTLELAAANKELEAFAYSVSHDLRAPLRHMDGFLSMLARHLGDRLDGKGSHYLKVAQGAAVRMGQLVDGLLSFSRLGRAELRMIAVDVDQVLASVIDEFKMEGGDRQIRWELGHLPVIHGDPTLLRLVFQNLVGNALKFTRHRPETVIEIQPIEGLAKESGFSIRDNGVGFDPAYTHKLFGVFQRLHREDEFEGTGIGLANVHRIVSRHGGRVWAEGHPGEGAIFFLAFPIKEEAT